LPSVFKSNAWGILHTLLEMFSYRLHHIQPHYRIQLLSQLHQLAQVQQMTQYQLHLWYVSFVLMTYTMVQNSKPPKFCHNCIALYQV